MPKPKYTIGAIPRQKVVAKGTKVTYYLNRGKKVDTVDHSDPIQRWVVWYSNTAQKHEGAPASYVVPKNRTQRDDFSHTWKYEGRHQVQLFLQTGSGAKESDFKKGPSFYQEVQPVKDILALRKSDWQHPRRMITFAEKYKTYLENLEKKAPTTDGVAKARQLEELEKYYQYHTWLKFLLAGYQDLKDDEFLPVYARFHEKQSQKTIDLNVFLVDQEDRWELVDWTAPRNPRKWGQPVRRRMHMSIITTVWESQNDYPPGHLRYFISHKVLQGRNTDVKGLFETGKEGVLDKIAEFLGWASAAAAIAAVTVGVLVPGSAWVTGLIWTSLLSSSTQAVINIGVRMGQRGTHWYEDLFDSLTILGNLFAAGAIWKQGATLLAQPARQKRAMKYMFYGQVATDGFQGILITVESYRELELLMQDGKKTPEERTEQARELLRSWGLSMTILFAGLHAGKKELDELAEAGINAKELEKRLAKLKDPDETIDLTKPPPVEGHTKEGHVKTRTRDVQPGRTGKAKKRTGYKGKKALPPEKRGMSKRDDAAFAQYAKDSGDIIIVRNSNRSALDYLKQSGYRPKPLEMKAKTRKTPPNKGLAAADPNDPRLQTMLKKEGITYEEYVKSIEKDGFVVGPAKDGYLVMDKQGNKFYSDYDLHGVYDYKTGRDSYTESKRRQLNRRFGGYDLIQHPPHDNWPERNNPKKAPNDGPQGNSTAYTPDGNAYHLETIADMKAFYKAHGIAWEDIYPNH